MDLKAALLATGAVIIVVIALAIFVIDPLLFLTIILIGSVLALLVWVWLEVYSHWVN
jgi:hypothetical protein